MVHGPNRSEVQQSYTFHSQPAASEPAQASGAAPAERASMQSYASDVSTSAPHHTVDRSKIRPENPEKFRAYEGFISKALGKLSHGNRLWFKLTTGWGSLTTLRRMVRAGDQEEVQHTEDLRKAQERTTFCGQKPAEDKRKFDGVMARYGDQIRSDGTIKVHLQTSPRPNTFGAAEGWVDTQLSEYYEKHLDDVLGMLGEDIKENIENGVMPPKGLISNGVQRELKERLKLDPESPEDSIWRTLGDLPKLERPKTLENCKPLLARAWAEATQIETRSTLEDGGKPFDLPTHLDADIRGGLMKALGLKSAVHLKTDSKGGTFITTLGELYERLHEVDVNGVPKLKDTQDNPARSTVIGLIKEIEETNGEQIRNALQHPEKLSDKQKKAVGPLVNQAWERIPSVDDVFRQPLRGQVLSYNYANAAHSGGAAMRGGSGSQEEWLFRETFLHRLLSHRFNPVKGPHLKPSEETGRYLPQDGGIYTPGVREVKGRHRQHNIFTMAAIDLRPRHQKTWIFSSRENPEYHHYLKKDGTLDMARVESDTKTRLRNGIRGAIAANITQLEEDLEAEGYEKGSPAFERQIAERRIKVLNLGAMGCGVFGNDPKAIANWILDVIEEPEFQGVFTDWIIPQGPPPGKVDTKKFYDSKNQLLPFDKVGKLKGDDATMYQRLAFEAALEERQKSENPS